MGSCEEQAEGPPTIRGQDGWTTSLKKGQPIFMGSNQKALQGGEEQAPLLLISL